MAIMQTAMDDNQKAPKREGPLQLDLGAILRRRVKGVGRLLLPAVGVLERVIHQDELNALLRATYPAEGSAFARALMRELDIEVDVCGLDALPAGENFIFASNHPLGGLDGIAMIGVLGERYGDARVRFLVNDMLMNVEPLQNVFLPVNKYGSQGRDAARAIADAYRSDMQIIIFPAGLVSRLGPEGVRDLEWQKAFVSKALEAGRRIVPVRFDGLNTPRFYRTARWRKRLGVRFNVEQALLPGELCRARGNRFGITFGRPVDASALRAAGMNPKQIAAEVRRMVYELPVCGAGRKARG